MAEPVAIVDDPNACRSDGQSWNSDFEVYVLRIVNHPLYAGMPNSATNGRIHWEVPPNRGLGRSLYTHHRRVGRTRVCYRQGMV